MSRTPRVLRFPSFRYLFLGQSASSIGDQVVIVALALYVTQRTGSATDLGFVLAAQALPMIALLLLGGVWADRLPRKRIMIAADGTRAVLHLTLAALIVTGGASLGELIVIEALFGAARAFFNPAYTGLIPETVPADYFQQAQALSGTTSNLAVLIGPALGTGLVLLFGAGAAFGLDALTFVISAALLLRVEPPPRAVAANSTANTVIQDLRAGFSEVASRPWVWATIAAFTVAVFVTYAQWYALAPSIAKTFYGGADRFGVLESVTGGGAVLGALIGMRWRPRRPLQTVLLLILVWPLEDIAFALLAPLSAVLALAFCMGLAFALFDVVWETALATHIPRDALSRVSSYDWMGSLAFLPLGFAIAGPLAAAVGARTVLGVGAGITFIALLAAATPRSTRALSLQQFADQVEVAAGGEAEVTHVDPLVGVVHERFPVEP